MKEKEKNTVTAFPQTGRRFYYWFNLVQYCNKNQKENRDAEYTLLNAFIKMNLTVGGGNTCDEDFAGF